MPHVGDIEEVDMSANAITVPPGPRGETIEQFAQRALQSVGKQVSQEGTTLPPAAVRDPRFGGSFVEFWLKLRTVKAHLAGEASHDETSRRERNDEKRSDEQAKATMDDEGCPNPGDKTDPRVGRKSREATPRS